MTSRLSTVLFLITLLIVTVTSSSHYLQVAHAQTAEVTAGQVSIPAVTHISSDQQVTVTAQADSTSQKFGVNVRRLQDYWGAEYLPDDVEFASDIYYVALGSISDFDIYEPLALDIAFPDGHDELKHIYYFDVHNKSWHLSPSERMYEPGEEAKGTVRTYTFQKDVIIAVVSDPTIKEWGIASWFSSDIIPRDRTGSANNDFPMDTRVRVTAINSGKQVETPIISTGPYVDHRIIDLGSDSFEQVAPLGAGVIYVVVEPVDTLPKVE